MNFRYKKYFPSIIWMMLFSCTNINHQENSSSTTQFEISDFNPISNYHSSETEPITNNQQPITLYLDYTGAIENGFVIPSILQTKEGMFISKFKIKNKSSKTQKFYYKLYYQNESYKFQEVDSSIGKYNPLSSENFYGSYEDVNVGFKSFSINAGDENELSDSIRIVGNPRNEKGYFENGHNDRWKRNPRVGNYSLMLVVSTEENFSKTNIPDFIQHIDKKNQDQFINPFYYFKYGDGKSLKEFAVIESSPLKIIARPDLGAGVYIDPSRYNFEEQKKYFCSNCAMDSNLFRKANIQQFLHGIDPSTTLENVPVIADVINENYSKKDYNYNATFYKRSERIITPPVITRHPCQTVISDSINKKIIIKNLKSEFGKWRKESVGMITRHGFTYGKWRAKVKLTQLLNKENVWNGLTNAIWLIYQPDVGDWNKRRICTGEGYMANYGSHKGDARAPQISYSEIDFEILKTVPYCPDRFYPPVYKKNIPDKNNVEAWNTKLPSDVLDHDGDITVSCTNWDMACPDPKNFGVGCQSVSYQGKEYLPQRWDHWYNALTEKTWASDDELFAGDFYYFEIDWQPDKIIWRIGPSPDKMRIVGYEDNTITNIPNNQMLLIVSQEWHNTKWWPLSPYTQDNVPFPKNDITGEILEIVVE